MGKTVGKKRPKATAFQPTSPFIQITASVQLPLSPCAYNHPLEGICAEHISPHLLSYWDKLHGILLSYTNPRITESSAEGIQASGRPRAGPILAISVAEYGVSYIWLTAEFLVFRPERGTVLEGEVILHSEGVLGLMCYNYFNAAIEREKLPSGWTWDGEQWLDGRGKTAQGTMKFTVVDFESSGQDGISIMGSLQEG